MTTLTPGMIAQLDTCGLTPLAVAERLGIGQKEAARMLVAAGAVRGAGRCYRVPSLERNAAAHRRLANPMPANGDFVHMDNAGKKWSANTVPPEARKVLL